jgi:hypothetical protein
VPGIGEEGLDPSSKPRGDAVGVVLTVLSVEVLVETEPWGQPLPEYVVSTIVICSGEGASPAVVWGTGLAAARTGRRRAAYLACIFAIAEAKIAVGEVLK